MTEPSQEQQDQDLQQVSINVSVPRIVKEIVDSGYLEYCQSHDNPVSREEYAGSFISKRILHAESETKFIEECIRKIDKIDTMLHEFEIKLCGGYQSK